MSQDQRYLLDYYLNLYNQTIRQIDLLHLSLDSIRYNMDTISGLTTPAQRRGHRHRHHQQHHICIQDILGLFETTWLCPQT